MDVNTALYIVISASLSVTLASISAIVTDLSPKMSECLSICLSVCLSVRKVYCGKTAEWNRMPFGVVNGVGRGMGVLDGVVIVKGRGSLR